ncbi:hypothetical protein ABZ769_18145 [Streptomyces olivoreticuli]
MRSQLAAVAAVIVLAATATACNEDTAATGGQSDPSAASSKNPAPQGSQPTQGGNGKGSKGEGQPRGAKITLKGLKAGEQLDVTFKGWADPVTSANQFGQPSVGNKYVAAQFELVNTGTLSYEDSPMNGAKVIDDKGQHFTGTVVSDVSVGPELDAGLKLPVGEKALGWIAFSVPDSIKAESVTFGMNSGLAPQTGQWSIKK